MSPAPAMRRFRDEFPRRIAWQVLRVNAVGGSLARALAVAGVCGGVVLGGPLPEAAAEARAGNGGRQKEAVARDEALHGLFGDFMAFRRREEPRFAASLDGRPPESLGSNTEADIRRRTGALEAFRGRLLGIPVERLSDDDRVHRDIFEAALAERLGDARFGAHFLPINADSGFHIGMARLPNSVPLRTVEDYEAYLRLLRDIPRYFDEHIALMRRGVELGITVPRVVLDGYEVTMSSHLVENAEDSVFFAPFRAFPERIDEAERARLTSAGVEAIREGPVAAYAAFLRFFEEEYRPNAREPIGASDLPDGRSYYAFLIGRFTTLDRTAEEVHRIGLAEVERIRGEMEEAMRATGFTGEFAEFLEFLRTDPQFYAEEPEDLLREAAWISKRMDGALPRLFRALPRQPYTVEPVPDAIAPKYTGGRYVGASLDSTQPGRYWVNTYRLDSRPLYTLEALSLHEAVPGHHLQISLAKELDLPEFRRYFGIGAYSEGWGLYSERLGLEVGFYTDPYSNFGRLTYEMWRACRLVVDTGMHALGWTRQQTLDYLAANTALSIHEITTETDRYIAWPGQALGYKMGELKIRELRELAETELGEDFDIRDFHDRVLLSGPVTLPVLDDLIRRWIAERTSAE